MAAPGMSLFQGAASIHINNSARDRLEEQEELEDQKRRNEELKQKLANAFDDLLDDDEASSVNSSGNLTLDHAVTNEGNKQTRPVPPTYVESINHFKDHLGSETQTYCDFPKTHHSTEIRPEKTTLTLGPYAAGDAQNHFYQQEYRGVPNGTNNFNIRQEYVNTEQLKVIYEMRVKECQQLASQIEKLDTEIDSLRARLAAAVSDRDKSDLSLQEAHQLLASSKHKLIEMEQQVSALTDKLVESDQEKEQLRLELRSANISLLDVQQRLQTLQVAHTHDTNALFREQQERYSKDIDRLHNDLLNAKNRLDEKENEVRMLEKHCLEKDREKEEILIEKGATINRLANELETAQSKLASGETARLREKVSQLTTERNTAKEQVKELGSKLEVTVHELVLCRNKLSVNQKEYENWRTTLNQILVESLPVSTYIDEPPSPGKLATLKEVLSQYKQQLQKLATLQDDISKRDKQIEVHRKQESELQARLEEHKGIEMQLNSRLAMLQNKLELLGSNSDSKLLETYKQQNEQLQEELKEAKAELKNLDLKYTDLELEYNKMKSEKGSSMSRVQEANADLLRDLERCSQLLKEKLKENADLKTLYLQACSSTDRISRELKDLQSNIQEEKEFYNTQEMKYVEQIESEKKQVEKLSAELSSSREELERANKRISELQKDFTGKQKEFAEKLNQFLADEKNAVRKEMAPCMQCGNLQKQIRNLDNQLNKCNAKLATYENNEVLMQELKDKAQYFQQYILERFHKLKNQQTVGTNTETSGDVEETANLKSTTPKVDSITTEVNPATPVEDLVYNCKESLAAKTVLMMKEKDIRNQIAEKFTLEIKTIEMNYVRKIKEMENEHLAAIAKLKELLERKAQEVGALKDFLMTERAKVTQVLEAKENEISILIKEHNEIQKACQRAKDSAAEWKLKSERYKGRVSRLSSSENLLKNEREEWQSKTSSDAIILKNMQNKVNEIQSRLEQNKEKYEKLQQEHQMLQEKYKNCKKTVFTYKEYVAKKDDHVTKEMNRIQDEYRKIFLRLQNQLNHYLQTHLQENMSKGSQIQQLQQYDFAGKMKKLKEDFAKLSESKFRDSDSQQ